jgi:hypothetical protein
MKSVDSLAQTVHSNRDEMRREVRDIKEGIDRALARQEQAIKDSHAVTSMRLSTTETRLTLILGGLILVGTVLPFGWQLFQRDVLDVRPAPGTEKARIPPNAHSR